MSDSQPDWEKRSKTALLRLQVYMSRCGVGSRRYCEKLIQQQRVEVNGQAATLGSKVSDNDQVRLDDRYLKLIRKKVYIAVHKPRGYLCANSDREGRPLVSDLLKGVSPNRLFHAGRLDFLSSGLIFYTNNGDFAYIVSHPSMEIEKDYLLETGEELPEAMLLKYQRGLMIDGEQYRLKSYSYKSPKKVLLTLTEGKNREIRKVCSHFGLIPRNIHRVRIGCVSLKGLPAGAFRYLSSKEVRWFFKQGGEAAGWW